MCYDVFWGAAVCCNVLRCSQCVDGSFCVLWGAVVCCDMLCEAVVCCVILCEAVVCYKTKQKQTSFI